jgi:hypothetical protein
VVISHGRAVGSGDEGRITFKVTTMRILFSGTPGYGHLLSLVPLAQAFCQQGDDAAFTTSESFSALFAAEEMELLPAGPPLGIMLGELF